MGKQKYKRKKQQSYREWLQKLGGYDNIETAVMISMKLNPIPRIKYPKEKNVETAARIFWRL